MLLLRMTRRMILTIVTPMNEDEQTRVDTEKIVASSSNSTSKQSKKKQGNSIFVYDGLGPQDIEYPSDNDSNADSDDKPLREKVKKVKTSNSRTSGVRTEEE